MSLPRAKKHFSQNWLIDPSVVEKIIDAAQIREGDEVLEVGPGTGLLTQALVDAGAHVTAIEADKDLIEPLQKQFGDRINLICGDVLHTNYQLPTAHYKLIANLPYSITSDILRHFLTHTAPPSRMVLMVQKEVADRIVAKPPDMSLLSVVCQLYAKCTRVARVPAGAFRPVPKVDSSVVMLDIKQSGDNRETERVIQIAKQGFSSRRKQLHKNLSTLVGITSEFVKKQLTELGLNPQIRAQDLTVDDWVALTHKINQK